jgi:hypothetical protein
MKEKRGNTGKLKFDFNPLAVLEVEFNDDTDRWFRVTAEYFRAFDGKRRITEPVEVIRGMQDIKMVTSLYGGPVYIWGTNTEMIKNNIGRLITGPEYEAHSAGSKRRG